MEIKDLLTPKSPEDAVLHFLDSEAAAKTPEEKAVYRFSRIILSAYVEALSEAGKLMHCRTCTVMNLPLYFGKLYAATLLPLIPKEKRAEVFARGCLQFEDTVFDDLKMLDVLTESVGATKN